ncbi:M48 family metallopeptidase [Tateyamaria sp. syn59]|uniref:tetratricopeptide repeat protein n=1 Tax=Tateyamaria sp. syn59 TaxID=2576942 RepID=UPI0011BE3C54|nr:hypothetical protein [Tateyamaria sp. syn59]
MTRALGLCSLWFASCVAAVAAEVPVRSGAHERFSRIVLDVAQGTEWSFKQNEAGAVVSLTDHTEGFDISRIFERIDRRHIEGVTASESALSLVFNCDCAAEVYTAGDRMIVVDIAKTTTPVTDDEEPGDSSPLNFTGSTQLQFPSFREQANVLVDTPEVTKSAEQRNSVFTPTPVTPPLATRPDQAQGDPTSLRQAREKLAERIGQAATTGVLNPSRELPTRFDRQVRPQIDVRIFDSSAPDNNSLVRQPPAGGNLRVTSSTDVPSQVGRQLQASTTSGVRCIEPSVVQIQEWGADTNFAKRTSALRRNLYSEFDRLNANVAIDLVQLYLHYGFGAEAIQILKMDADLQSSNPALMDIALIMEYGGARTDGYLSNFMDCDSDVALWAILSKKDLNASERVDAKAAIRTLSSLPPHLREHIAPALSKKLLAYGDEAGAAAALRGLERTAQPLPPAAELAKADIELSMGDVVSAQNRLQTVVASNDEQSAEALVRYVDTHFDTGVDIDEDIATLVEAYAIEFRNDPLGDELRSTHVLALAKSGQFDAAFSALDRIRSSKMKDTTDQLRSSVLEVLSRDADDATFVRHTFTSISDLSMNISQSAALLVVARLVELGFFIEAEQLLFVQSDLPQTRQNRTMRAEVSLGLSRPLEALSFLRGLDGEQAARLRAEAHMLIGDHDLAHEILTDLGAETDSVQAAWLSDDWQKLLEPDVPVLGPTLQIAASQMDTSADLDGMLGRIENALEDSADAREVIEQLITANTDSVLPSEN